MSTPFIVFVLVVVALAFLRRRTKRLDDWLRTLAELDFVTSKPFDLCFREWKWLGLGAVVLAAIFTILEVRQPYYFTQDDTSVAGLPSWLLGYRTMWSGVFPDYTPHVFMGAPFAGISGITYPPSILSYAIARHLLGNEFTTIEVFAAMHLLAGFVLIHFLARELDIAPPIAAACALSIVTCGGIVIMGRSWTMFIPLVVWLPMLWLLFMRFRRGPVAWGFTALLGLTLGLSFHLGFSQMWFYLVFFGGLFLAVELPKKEIPLRRLMWVIPGFLIGFALAVPLLLSQSDITAGYERNSCYGGGIGNGLLSLILPYPLAVSEHPNGWGSTDAHLAGHLYYMGTVFIAMWFVVQVAVFSSPIERIKRALGGPLVCGIVAFWLAGGVDCGLWTFFCDLPVIGKINNHPFRMLPYLAVFSIVVGAKAVDVLLKRRARSAILSIAVFATVSLLLYYHAVQSKAAFYSYGYEPYPPMPADLRSLLNASDGADTISTGRVLPLARLRSVLPSYPYSMSHRFPEVYGVLSFFGYDPVIENTPPWRNALGRLAANPLETITAYGVRWIILHESLGKQVFTAAKSGVFESNVPLGFIVEGVSFENLSMKLASNGVTVWEVKGALPLSFAQSDPNRSFPVAVRPGAVEVALKDIKREEFVVVNFLRHRYSAAYVDGVLRPIGADAWDRIVVPVKPGDKSIRIGYSYPWSRGIGFAGVIAMIAIVLGLFLRRFATS